MNNEDTQTLCEAFKQVTDAIYKLAKTICEAFKQVFKQIVIRIVKILNSKKACKILHICLHTKKKRIRKKQSKRLNKLILSYMPF